MNDKPGMNVPFLDLKAQYANIRDKLVKAVDAVLESQGFILGPVVEKFERDCAAYCNTKYSVGMSSGTDALLVALMAIDIKPGDEVITTDYTFFATANVIYRLGARPVFIDIDPITYNIQPSQIEKAITSKTRVIMPVHLYGQCADMDAILEIARKHKITVIEDTAQAFGASYHNKMVGSFGEMGCVSFYPTKNLGGIGEGGLITLQNPELYQKIVDLRTQGNAQRGPYRIVGGNFRLDAIQAAALQVKLEYLRDWNKTRSAHANTYRRLFKEAGLEKKVTLPQESTGCVHIYHQFVIRVEQREKLQNFLKLRNVGNAVYYPRPLHHEPCFAYLGYALTDFPESNRAAQTTLALPIYPELTQEQLKYVVESIREFYQSA